jgi:two-component system chemotaxis response regulator CheB
MDTERTVARQVVAVGASAGGVEALRDFVGGLPSDLPAAVLIVTHLPEVGTSALPEILQRCGPLPAFAARHGEHLLAGRIYIAVHDRHLLVKGDHVLLSSAPKQNRARPAIDALFRSAARWFGSRAVGVVLSGALDDGAAGSAAIAASGGAIAVQDPRDAQIGSMPTAALAVVQGAAVAPAIRLGAEVQRLLLHHDGLAPVTVSDETIREAEMMENPMAAGHGSTPGEPGALSCPDCTGGMNIVRTGPAVHYLCHVGHAWSPQALAAAQREKIEVALWTAVSMLEEQSAVHRHVAEQAARGGASLTIRHQLAAADEAMHAAGVIRMNFPDLLPALPEPELPGYERGTAAPEPARRYEHQG